MPPRKPPAADAPENEPVEPEETAVEPESKTVLVSVGGFIDRFVSGVPDVPEITRRPVAVPRSSLSALRDVAKASRVPLIIKEKS